MYGHLESLLVLLNHKATINCRPNGKAAIHIACETANVECLKILCNHGAKLNCFTMSGQAPLHFCTTRTSIPCAQQLIWRGKVKLWNISHGLPRDGEHDLCFLSRGNLFKDMCIYPTHGWSISSSQTPFPHLFNYQRKFLPFWFLTPSVLPCPWPPALTLGLFPTSVSQQNFFSESGSLYLSIFSLSSSSRFTIEMFSCENAPLSSYFLFKFPWSQ